jgi:hypothetical protein
METALEIRRAVEREIRTAFRDVTLGRGMSLRQARSVDHFGDAVGNAHSDALKPAEIVDDWSRVPLDELEEDCIAHLDAEGFRYHIPALMLSLLDHYDSGSMRVIGTLDGLYPREDAWDYHMYRYSLLNDAQKRAIAGFLVALPKLIPLDFQDHKIVPRALRNYWGQYLQTKATE